MLSLKQSLARFSPMFLLFWLTSLHATAEYRHAPDEYVEIYQGTSPNGQYSVAAHGEGQFGWENFHLI
jgi:hypothetical protein